MDRLGKNINLQILSVYKKPHVSLKKRPEVVFASETGIDAGALTKEYFSVGMAALAKEALTAGDGSYLYLKVQKITNSLLQTHFYSSVECMLRWENL